MSSSATPFEVSAEMTASARCAAIEVASSTVSARAETPRLSSRVSGVPVTSPAPVTEIPVFSSFEVFTVISLGEPQAERSTARVPITATV